MQFVHNGQQPQVYNTNNQNNPTELTFNDNGRNICNPSPCRLIFQFRRTSTTSIEAIYAEKQIVLLMKFHPGSGGILSFVIQIPRSLCNDPNTRISGHLGNCDGNKDNDHVPDFHGEIPIVCNNTIIATPIFKSISHFTHVCYKCL